MQPSTAVCVLCLLLRTLVAQDVDVPVTQDYDIASLLRRNKGTRQRSTTTALPTSLLHHSSPSPETYGEGTSTSSSTEDEMTRVFSTLKTAATMIDETSVTTPMVPRNETRAEMRKRLEKDMKRTVSRVMKMVLPYVMQGDQSKISSPCLGSLMKFVQGIQRLKLWAFKMLDATGKIPAGIFTGTMTEMGSFDQCLNLEVWDRRKRMDFRGQYCTLLAGRDPSLPIPKNISLGRVYRPAPDEGLFDSFEYTSDTMYYLSFRMGVCIPSTCSAEDLRQIGQQVLKSMEFHVTVRDCHVKTEIEPDAAHIIMTCVIGVFLLLAAGGTVIELRSRKSATHSYEKPSSPGVLYRGLTAFSVRRNFQKLMSTETSEVDLKSLHGLRLFCILYVILVHTYIWVRIPSFGNMSIVFDWFNDITFEVIHNAWLSVDSFFVISGILLTYHLLGNLEKKKGHVNFFLLLIMRYLRLTPALMFVSGLVFFLPWLTNGPFWDELPGAEVKACYSHWWANLLYYNDFMPLDKICMHHSWYVHCDLQLFVLGFIILYLLYRKPVLGFILMFLATLGGILGVGFITYMNEYPPAPMLSIPNEKLVKNVVNEIHIRPYTHIGPYCVGLLIGYLVVKYRNISLKPVVQALLWCSSFSILMACLLGTHEWNKGNFPPTIVTAVYASLYRIGWSLGVGWLAFACITGHGGPANAVLSYKPLIPFSRLTYCAYLIQGLVIWTRYGSVKERMYGRHYTFVYEYCGHLVIICGLAMVCHLLVEAPLANLTRMAFSRKEKKDDDDIQSLPKSHPVQLKRMSLSNDYNTQNGTTKNALNREPMATRMHFSNIELSS